MRKTLAVYNPSATITQSMYEDAIRLLNHRIADPKDHGELVEFGQGDSLLLIGTQETERVLKLTQGKS